jgi:hypothetical protein
VPVETLHCCIPLPVGEEKIALLHMQQDDLPLSHREREAAEQCIRRIGAGEGWLRITIL